MTGKLKFDLSAVPLNYLLAVPLKIYFSSVLFYLIVCENLKHINFMALRKLYMILKYKDTKSDRYLKYFRFTHRFPPPTETTITILVFVGVEARC